MDTIAIEQWTITMIGAIIFGLSIVCARYLLMGDIPHIVYVALMKYVAFIVIGFYIAFPFAQGFLWYLETGANDRLFEVTVTYWLFVGIAISVSVVTRLWRSAWKRF